MDDVWLSTCGKSSSTFPMREHGCCMAVKKDDCEATQFIELMVEGYTPQHVDAQRLRVHIDGYLANSGTDDDHDDQVRFRIVFLDEDQVGVGHIGFVVCWGTGLGLSRCSTNDTRWYTVFTSNRIGRLENGSME